MTIRNKSRLTKQMQMEFSRRLFINGTRKTLIFAELAGAIGIALCLSFYIEKYWVAIALGVLMIAFPIVSIVLFNNGLKKQEKDPQSTFEELDVDFEIEETIITADIKWNGQSNKMSMALNTFTQIFETKELFVLILENQQGFFIEKSGFESIEDCQKVAQILKLLPCYKKI